VGTRLEWKSKKPRYPMFFAAGLHCTFFALIP
jgi:hypothetical protein